MLCQNLSKHGVQLCWGCLQWYCYYLTLEIKAHTLLLGCPWLEGPGLQKSHVSAVQSIAKALEKAMRPRVLAQHRE